VATYYTLVPAFQQLIAKHGGNLPAFYAEAKSVASTPKKERHERLVALANAAPPVAALSSRPAR
jgi:predicted aminopeptidase